MPKKSSTRGKIFFMGVPIDQVSVAALPTDSLISQSSQQPSNIPNPPTNQPNTARVAPISTNQNVQTTSQPPINATSLSLSSQPLVSQPTTNPLSVPAPKAPFGTFLAQVTSMRETIPGFKMFIAENTEKVRHLAKTEQKSRMFVELWEALPESEQRQFSRFHDAQVIGLPGPSVVTQNNVQPVARPPAEKVIEATKTTTTTITVASSVTAAPVPNRAVVAPAVIKPNTTNHPAIVNANSVQRPQPQAAQQQRQQQQPQSQQPQKQQLQQIRPPAPSASALPRVNAFDTTSAPIQQASLPVATASAKNPPLSTNAQNVTNSQPSAPAKPNPSNQRPNNNNQHQPVNQNAPNKPAQSAPTASASAASASASAASASAASVRTTSTVPPTTTVAPRGVQTASTQVPPPAPASSTNAPASSTNAPQSKPTATTANSNSFSQNPLEYSPIAPPRPGTSHVRSSIAPVTYSQPSIQPQHAQPQHTQPQQVQLQQMQAQPPAQGSTFSDSPIPVPPHLLFAALPPLDFLPLSSFQAQPHQPLPQPQQSVKTFQAPPQPFASPTAPSQIGRAAAAAIASSSINPMVASLRAQEQSKLNQHQHHNVQPQQQPQQQQQQQPQQQQQQPSTFVTQPNNNQRPSYHPPQLPSPHSSPPLAYHQQHQQQQQQTRSAPFFLSTADLSRLSPVSKRLAELRREYLEPNGTIGGTAAHQTAQPHVSPIDEPMVVDPPGAGTSRPRVHWGGTTTTGSTTTVPSPLGGEPMFPSKLSSTTGFSSSSTTPRGFNDVFVSPHLYDIDLNEELYGYQSNQPSSTRTRFPTSSSYGNNPRQQQQYHREDDEQAQYRQPQQNYFKDNHTNNNNPTRFRGSGVTEPPSDVASLSEKLDSLVQLISKQQHHPSPQPVPSPYPIPYQTPGYPPPQNSSSYQNPYIDSSAANVAAAAAVATQHQLHAYYLQCKDLLDENDTLQQSIDLQTKQLNTLTDNNSQLQLKYTRQRSATTILQQLAGVQLLCDRKSQTHFRLTLFNTKFHRRFIFDLHYQMTQSRQHTSNHDLMAPLDATMHPDVANVASNVATDVAASGAASATASILPSGLTANSVYLYDPIRLELPSSINLPQHIFSQQLITTENLPLLFITLASAVHSKAPIFVTEEQLKETFALGYKSGLERAFEQPQQHQISPGYFVPSPQQHQYQQQQHTPSQSQQSSSQYSDAYHQPQAATYRSRTRRHHVRHNSSVPSDESSGNSRYNSSEDETGYSSEDGGRYQEPISSKAFMQPSVRSRPRPADDDSDRGNNQSSVKRQRVGNNDLRLPFPNLGR